MMFSVCHDKIVNGIRCLKKCEQELSPKRPSFFNVSPQLEHMSLRAKFLHTIIPQNKREGRTMNSFDFLKKLLKSVC